MTNTFAADHARLAALHADAMAERNCVLVYALLNQNADGTELETLYAVDKDGKVGTTGIHVLDTTAGVADYRFTAASVALRFAIPGNAVFVGTYQRPSF